MARQPEVQYIRYYTDGSAARKPEPILPKIRKTVLPKVMPKIQQVIYVDPLALGGIIVSAIMLVLMIVGCVRVFDTRAQLQQMEAYVTSLEAQNRQMQTEYDEKVDIDEIREYAVALGLVPIDQVQQYTIHISMPEPEPEPTTWERLCAFLEGLLA